MIPGSQSNILVITTFNLWKPLGGDDASPTVAEKLEKLDSRIHLFTILSSTVLIMSASAKCKKPLAFRAPRNEKKVDTEKWKQVTYTTKLRRHNGRQTRLGLTTGWRTDASKANFWNNDVKSHWLPNLLRSPKLEFGNGSGKQYGI